MSSLSDDICLPPPICGAAPDAVQTTNEISITEAALDQVISGAYVFTVERSARGYALNKMANSLSSPDNRARFSQDEATYMRDMGCSNEQVDLVARRDWKGMLESGASIYLMLKIGAAVGVSLPEIGAHSAGMTLAEYNARKAH
jgi:protocatechuate 4,5-dioxygenase alpha subunit